MTSKFVLKLLRSGVAKSSLPSITDVGVIGEPIFTRPSFVDTVNDIRVQYSKRNTVPIPETRIAVDVGVGWEGLLVVMSDGTAWGWNGAFRVGVDPIVFQGDDITKDLVQVEPTLGLRSFVKCDVFGDQFHLLDSVGKLYSHGYHCYGTSAILRHSAYCACWHGSPCSGDPEAIVAAIYPCSIYAWDGQEGYGGVLIDEVNQWSHVATGGWSAQGIKTDGSLWGWGYNAYGMIGIGNPYALGAGSPDETCIRPLPEACDVSRSDWVAVDTGQICAGAIDGDGYIWTWGLNSGGSLGHGYESDYPDGFYEQGTPIRIEGIGNNWIDIESSEYSMMALNSAGELWFWGEGYRGNCAHVPGTLGCDDYGAYWCEHWSPVKISGSHNFIAFSHGWYHTIAIDSDNNVWVAGMDDGGCLGLGLDDEEDHYTWEQIPDFQASYVDAGYSVSIAIGLDGTVWAWGWLGDFINTPRQLKFGTYWAE